MIEEYTVNSRKRLVVAVAATLGILMVLGLAAILFNGRGAGRPVPAPQTVSFDGGTAEGAQSATGETITLQPEQVRNAGVVVEAAGEGLSDSSGAVRGTGIIQADAYKDVRVTALVGGRIKSFTAEPGAIVSKGAVIAIAESEEYVRAQGDFLTARAASESAKLAHDRALKMLDINQPGRSDYEMAVRSSASATAVLAEARSRFERAGRMLDLGSMSREQYEAEQAKYRTAEAEAAEAAARLDRAKRLLEISPEAKAQAEATLVELNRAQGEFAAAAERLRLIGAIDSDLAGLRKPSDIQKELRLRAPVSGTVISRGIASGELFEKGRELFRVADLSELWFVAQVFERDLPNLKVGSAVEVGLATSAEPVRGRVAFVDPSLNEKTRTAQVRVVLTRPKGDVRLGSYATLSTVSNSEGRKVALIKSAAVQRISDSDFVFVSKSDGVTFELRQVRLGAESGGLVPVLEGLVPGEKIVIDGAFLLRSEFVKRNPR